MNRALILMCIFGTAQAFAEEPKAIKLDVEQALNLALLNNRDLMSSRLNVAQAQSGTELRENAFRVTLKPEGNAAVSEDVKSWFYGLNASKKFSPGTEVTTRAGFQSFDPENGTPQEGAKVSLELKQPLFRRMGKAATLEPLFQARSDLLQAERALLLRQSALVLELLRSYEQVLVLQRRVSAAEKSLARLDGLLELSKVRETQGRSTRVDLLRVELQQGQAAVRVVNDREQLAAERENFWDLINPKASVAPLVLEQPEALTIEIPPFEQAVASALENRLDYGQALDDYRDIDRKFDIAQRRKWPDLELTSRYERSAEENSDAMSLEEETWFLGLQLGSDYNPRDEKIVIRQVANRRALSRLELETRADAVGREVRTAIRAYRRAQADLTITRRNRTLADKRLELARSLYDLGRGDNFSVTDAETAFLDAESAAFAAEAEATLTGYRLLDAMGLLIEAPDHLKPESLSFDD